ncbi:sensor histidine kinase [Rubrivivax rivuli]|uniref:histidine kinase n=1 Tax=Rubrivivax rivuli TaxID=1862385 RepID=A0A437RSK8_9BURK|nr:histidine kinase [Rubrivivax rivuli]RVU49722.1 sensor histidine kinase [Rubrivivax rivuli]
MNPPSPWPDRWQRFSSGAVRAFHAYGTWLVGISWRRFIVLALALIVVMAIVHDSPPFTWRFTRTVEVRPPSVVVMPPAAPRAPAAPKPREPKSPGDLGDVQISIGEDGVRITRKPSAAASAASASAAASAAAGASVDIRIPPGQISDAIRQAVEEARRDIEEAAREAREEAAQAERDAEQARRDAESALADLVRERTGPRFEEHETRVGIGDFLMQLTLLWVLGSAVLKFTYKGRMQAEVKAAQATETAEAEALKRQVVEARMAAMQAQVEPHFLFNTLASIDHLIETDPARASQMQKNLIALLRASMPTMREANGDGMSGVRDLGRELAVIRPYLEILKVRMEERLATDIQVPDGLLSAEFPPMMIQTLVENAIKHGLEPKAEGGTLQLKAEIVHGRLQVTVADTGLGFGKAATAGTGVGLANIRERLQLLYGPKASLTVAANQPNGTVVTITVPYKAVEGSFA